MLFVTSSVEDLLGVVASETNDKEVILEFTSWKDCHFLLKERDDFLASVADVMGMEKGSTFSIRLEPFRSFTFPEQQNALHQVSNQPMIVRSMEISFTPIMRTSM